MSTSTASKIPDAEVLANAAKLEILDCNGQKVTFGSLFNNQKTVVVFIRHFFCGICQMYVESLAEIPQDAFDKAETNIVVVGCGDWQPIRSYLATTNFKGEIYADPTRTLYRVLGMTIETLNGTPAGQNRKSYLTAGRVANALQSIWKGPLKHLHLIGKQGNISQLGGDFVFGPGLSCTFAWRMQHTEDHVEISELLKAAGIEHPVN